MSPVVYIALASALAVTAEAEPLGALERICPAAAAVPVRIEMTPSRRAGGARAAYEMRFASSSYAVTVSEAGHHLYDIHVAVVGLPGRPGRTYVAWAASSDLAEWTNLGAIAEDQPVEGQVGWNKFIVFVTGEESADVEAWSQEFYFSALSPSARMHTMMGHGPFSSEPCPDLRN